MQLSHSVAHLLGLFAVLVSWSTFVGGSEFDICASINTSDLPKNISIWQTNGLCQTFCTNDYAYAITQDHNCWCSNFTPDKSFQLSGSRCSEPCPAWTPEHCGGPGAFSYIVLNKILPSGSKGLPSSSETGGPSGSASSSSSKNSPTTSTSKTSSAVAKTTGADGSVKTVFANPTNTAAADSGGSGSKHGLGTGAIAGIAVGVIGAVLVGAALVVFWIFRRRKQQQEQDGYQDDPSFRGSSPGMGGSSRQEMSMSGGAPASPNSAGNRNSALQIDPRMDPFKQGLYVRSASHESVNTLRDDHDYSRRIQQPKVLRATNPDPETEE